MPPCRRPAHCKLVPLRELRRYSQLLRCCLVYFLRASVLFFINIFFLRKVAYTAILYTHSYVIHLLSPQIINIFNSVFTLFLFLQNPAIPTQLFHFTLSATPTRLEQLKRPASYIQSEKMCDLGIQDRLTVPDTGIAFPDINGKSRETDFRLNQF